MINVNMIMPTLCTLYEINKTELEVILCQLHDPNIRIQTCHFTRTHHEDSEPTGLSIYTYFIMLYNYIVFGFKVCQPYGLHERVRGGIHF